MTREVFLLREPFPVDRSRKASRVDVGRMALGLNRQNIGPLGQERLAAYDSGSFRPIPLPPRCADPCPDELAEYFDDDIAPTDSAPSWHIRASGLHRDLAPSSAPHSLPETTNPVEGARALPAA